MTIKYKLFLTLLLTSIIVSSGMFLFMQWSFDRGFLNYVNSQRIEELHRLSDALIKHYKTHNTWDLLRNNERLWHRLTLASVFDEKRPPMPHNPPGRGPKPFPPGEQEPPFALFTADKKPIFAPEEPAGQLTLTPLKDQGTTVGYLALVPLRHLSDSGDLLFVEQQTESFALVALGMALLSLLLSYPLTVHLLRPIKELTAGTRHLIAGRYKTRIPVVTKDELGQLSTDFNSLAMTLEKNEQVRQQWVADISHELRTPLAVLRGDVEALQDGIRTPDPKALDMLHNEVMHLGRLVDDLYELSMSDIGALSYKKTKTNPIEILKETIELFDVRFADKEIELASDLPPGLSVSLMSDPDRLQQLFTNLLENSLRYTDVQGQARVRAHVNKNTFICEFDDSPPGVSPEQQAELFNRLYRVEGSRNRSKGGAGLGLSICSNIVEAHQGTISAGPSDLGGLKIVVSFPLES